MTRQEFEKKLNELSDQDFDKFKTAVGAQGRERQWYIDHFANNPQLVEAKYCQYFGVPTEQEKVTQATVSAAQAATVSANAAVESATYARRSSWAAWAAILISLISLLVALLK